jgi:hypothetical protein
MDHGAMQAATPDLAVSCGCLAGALSADEPIAQMMCLQEEQYMDDGILQMVEGGINHGGLKRAERSR